MDATTTILHPGKFHTRSRKSSRLPDLPFERFDHRNGLTSLQVHMTIMSQDGRLWAATPAGLACYDGVQTHMYGRKQGLVNHGLRTLAIHPKTNELWIGTDAGIEVLDIREGIPRPLWSKALGTVNSLGLQNYHGLIGCSQGLIFVTKTNTFEPATGYDAAGDTIKKILAHSDDTYWVIGSGTGLTHISGTGTKIDIEPEHQIIGKPSVLTNGPDGTIFVGGENGFGQLDNGGSVLNHRQTSAPIEAILWDQSQLWLAYNQSVVSMPIGRSNFSTTKTRLNKVVVKHIMADRFDNIWLSTSGQALLKVSSFRNTFVEDFPTETGHILSIYNDQTGRLIGGSTGLALGNGEIILDNLEVWDVLRDDQDKVWCATDRGLYCTPNPQLSFAYKQPGCPVIEAPCRALAIFKNRLYVASIRGLARLNSEGASEVTDPNGQSFGYVYSLHIGPDQALWIATLGRGVFRYDGQDMQSIKFPQLGESANVYAITHDKSGRLYFAHDNMISRMDSPDVGSVLYKTESSVAAWSLGWMSGGFLIAGSSDGLIFLDDETGKIKHWISGNFEDVPWEFTTSRSLAIVDSSVYCGLGSGLRTVKVHELIPKNEAPQARLSKMNWRGADFSESDSAVFFGKWHLKIELSTDWFLDNCQMRYRLTGFDSEWSDYQELGPVYYTSLPEGHYSLDVELKSPLVGLGKVNRIVDFEVLPREMAEKG